MKILRTCAYSSIAAGFMALVSLTPALAADQPIDVSTTAQFIAMPSPTGPSTSNTSYNGLAETNVSVGFATPGLPCGNCVGGAGTPNIGLPWPVFAVNGGSILTASTWFESTMYTGPCTAGLIVKQGTQVVSAGSFPLPGGCQAGFLYGVFFTIRAPNTTGFTTVIGTVSGGTNKSGADTFINVQ